jgi:hypothetical protein
MYSRTELLRIVSLVSAASSVVACSASGDQILGRVVTDNSTPIAVAETDASSPDATIADCEGREFPTQPISIDLYALIDRSLSMQDPDFDKWELLVTSFTRFLQSGVANQTNFGVGFFPMGPDECIQRNDPHPCFRNGPGCDPATYDRARVEIGKLPDIYQSLAMSIFQQTTGGPTLMRPALAGSLVHAARWEYSHPGRRVVQILIAGGPPSSDTCQPNGVNDCAYVVSQSDSKTYVIAFGTDKTPLEPIATAGGGEAFFIDIRDMMPDRLGEIIEQIRTTETGCEWAVPPPPSPGFDYGKLNVEIAGLLSTLPQAPTFLSKVRNRQACDATKLQWYYDNNQSPKRIIACGSTCNAIHQSPAAVPTITLGCQSITTGSAK